MISSSSRCSCGLSPNGSCNASHLSEPGLRRFSCDAHPSRQHGVQDDSGSPHVRPVRVPPGVNLWGRVPRGADQGARFVRIRREAGVVVVALRELRSVPRVQVPPWPFRVRGPERTRNAKVRQRDVVVLVDQDVLGLDVPVDDALVVEMLKGDDLSLLSARNSTGGRSQVGDLLAPRTIAVLDAQGRRRVA